MLEAQDTTMRNLLNKILCDLTVAQRNIQILHWNLRSDLFLSLHPYLGEVYEKLNDYIDQIGEEMRKDAYFSYATLSDCLDNSEIREIESRQPYTGNEAVAMTIVNLEALFNITHEATTHADEKEYWSTVELLSAQLSYYKQALYFLESTTA